MKIVEPIYRFDKFDKNWLFVKISDIAGQFKTGGTPSTKEPIFWDGTIPWIQSSDLQKDILFCIKPQKFISEKGLQNSSAKLIPKNSIAIVTRVGVGKLAIIDQDYATSQDFLSLSDFGGDIQFIVYSIYRMLQKESTQLQGTSIKGITKEDLLSKKISLPEIEEQSAIGSLFRTLDDLLASYKHNLANYQSLKATMLSKMFPKAGQTVPEIRLDGFEGEWKEMTLGSLGSVAMNKRIFKDETSENGDIPFYKIGTFGGTADAFISKEKFKEYKEKYPYPEIGDILISASGSIGRTVVYNGEDAYYQDSNIVWLKHDQQLDNSYLQQYYEIIKWSGIEGTTIKRLYNKNILETNIFLPPSVYEQQAVGSYFSNLDNLIATHQEKISQLETLKKKLLQDMFI
ncbi:restriction endonuclease subunit S [Streptococcus sp. DFI.7.26]|uniref:restriction endonuclease subunit S n=1 Tax=Streptococcus sp. DFI.7.26 TaxID=2916965 RepID=UPI001EE8C484|nr:restriction endonuclease subunit S [Streptococcus sp. DFI.7.26]MCG5642824.1 restriction endonuclease subunit S [Streptococcus sp. DFI.7.26]